MAIRSLFFSLALVLALAAIPACVDPDSVPPGEPSRPPPAAGGETPRDACDDDDDRDDDDDDDGPRAVHTQVTSDDTGTSLASWTAYRVLSDEGGELVGTAPVERDALTNGSSHGSVGGR